MISINKEFNELKTEEEKLKYIEIYPDRILLIDRDEAMRIEEDLESKDCKLLAKLKRVAIKNEGDLVLFFPKNGLYVDETLMDLAFKQNPDLIRYVEEYELTPKRISIAIRHNVNNIDYVPEDWFNYDNSVNKGNLRVAQKSIRKTVLDNEKVYRYLSSRIINGKYSAYTALNAYSNDNEFNTLKVNPDIWESNGGKIMFKIMRKNMDIGMKMLDETWRRTLAIAILDKDPSMFEKFPPIIKWDKKVRAKLYRVLRDKNVEEVTKYFKEEEIPALEKKYQANKKRIETNKKKREELNQHSISLYDREF